MKKKFSKRKKKLQKNKLKKLNWQKIMKIKKII